MKFTKENVIKVYGELNGFDIDDEMLEHDDFVITINEMEIEEETECN